MTLQEMTRERANEILQLWKYGFEQYPAYIIRMALYRTGDLENLA